MNIFGFIAGPLGKFLYFIYNTFAFHNYGLAILFFTLIIRLCLLPLTLKQYKSSAKMQAIQPKLQEIQKRYKTDKEKLNQEMMRLYKENNVNPAGGCLPLLIQMPFLFSLYWDIIQPLTYQLGKTAAQITALVTRVASMEGTTVASFGYQKEIHVLEYFNNHKDKLSQVADLLKPNELLNMNFLGLHLGVIPSISTDKLFGPQAGIYLPLLILPILAVVTTYLSSKLSMPTPVQSKNPNDKPPAGSGMQNTMLFIGPMMTLIFSFSMPAGVALYWIAGSVVQITQQRYINKNILKKGAKPKDDTKLEANPGGKKRQIGSGSNKSGT